MTIPVLYVLGAGHCGSTLLSLLLNGHSRCVAVSELSKLADSIRGRDPVLERPEWQAAAQRYEQRTSERFEELNLGHPSLRRLANWSDREIESWATRRAAVLQSLLEASGRTHIVDASKSWQPAYLMHRSRQFDVRVVHLVRDVRGVVHSYAKKYGNLRHGFGKWLKPGIAALALSPRFRGGWLRVRYEDLAREPATTLTAICDHVGLAYEPGMLQFREREWLGIGGNRMSKRQDSTIHIDERWRTEMAPLERALIGVFGAPFNKLYGY